jgi:hypothetical protein
VLQFCWISVSIVVVMIRNHEDLGDSLRLTSVVGHMIKLHCHSWLTPQWGLLRGDRVLEEVKIGVTRLLVFWSRLPRNVVSDAQSKIISSSNRNAAMIAMGSKSSGRFAVKSSWVASNTYVSDEFHEIFIDYLPEHAGWVKYQPGMAVDFLLYVEDYSQLLADHSSLVRDRIATKVGIFVDDLHFFSAQQREMKLKVFQLPGIIVFSTYAYQALEIYPELRNTMGREGAATWLWLPHAAASRFQRLLNREASQAHVLLTGSVALPWYPHRAAAHQIKLRRQMVQ